MKISNSVHLIRKDFYVTEEVKRYVNIYLITGANCYLIDTGVAGSEVLIAEYLESIGRKLTDIKGVFLTHAHPDHIGAAAEIKRQTGCKIYAPIQGLDWIENIHRQFDERPIPNFFNLVSESVDVDCPLGGGEIVELEEGISVKAVFTPGHSHDSMSYVLNDEVVFIGDAIPVDGDLPIFVDFKKSVESIDVIENLEKVELYCPAWDEVYDRKALCEVADRNREMLYKLRKIVMEVEKELGEISDEEKVKKICQRADMAMFSGNPLFRKSIEACRNECF